MESNPEELKVCGFVHYSTVFKTINFLIKNPERRIIPMQMIISGELVRSSFKDRYNPAHADKIPAKRASNIRRLHSFVNNAENDAGSIRKANTVRMPPIRIASIMIIPKVK